MLTMPHLTEMLCSWLFFTVSSSGFYTSLFSGFFPKQLSQERLSPPPQSYTLSSIQWVTLWKINEAVFSGCFLGGQNVSKKWTDPSVALEHRQLNLQSSKLTGTFGQVKTSKYFSHTTTKPSLFFRCYIFLPVLMSNTNRSGQCCSKLHCLISFFIPCDVNTNIGFR